MIEGLLGNRMSKKIPMILLFIVLVGCLGQAPALKSTETPSPTQTPSPTPFDPSEQIAELENYGTNLGLSQDILQILRPAYSFGKASEEYKALVKDVMLRLSQVPEKYQSFATLRKKAANMIMEDGHITAEDKEAISAYESLVKSSIAEMDELTKDNFTLEDGQQTDLEKSFLANPNDQKLAQDLKKYYLGEIEKIYPELASELNKLPELSPLNVNEKSLEALEDIYGLLLTAEPYKNYNDRFKSNVSKANETWEAFELMIKGGTPDPKDYTYPVPNYNTELQALLWIAEQNEFKKNDTLAQAIAMDNGLYITIGDEQVKKAVYKDMNDLLDFFRETNIMQIERGFYLLEDYPLEVKISLAWTGGESANVAKSHALSFFLDKPLDLKSYKWDVTTLKTIRKMRELTIENDWWHNDTDKTAKMIMEYFYYDQGHWIYTLHGGPKKIITVNNEIMSNYEYGSTNYCFQQYLDKGVVEGVSYDFLPFIETFLKSIGIATNHIWLTVPNKPAGEHLFDFVIYYRPSGNSWTAYPREVDDWLYEKKEEDLARLILFKIPVTLDNYLNGIAEMRQEYKGWYVRQGLYTESNYDNFVDEMYVLRDDLAAYISIFDTSSKKGMKFNEMRTKVFNGIPLTQMKQWLLYSSG